MEAAGVMTPIVKINLNYHQSSFYDDELIIHVYVEEPVRSCITFRYEVKNLAGELILDGVTKLAFITADTHQPCRPPLALRTFFK
jgi:acyl-CoA thioester hydrolase